jgi:ABC-type branched-subunit amino acid transport system substrate-binding protein
MALLTTSVLAAVPAAASNVNSTNSGNTGGSPTMAICNAQGNGSPGVTPTSITLGAISTLTGPIASNFESMVPGIRAYLAYVNAHGGVYGRKLNLTYSLDDGGDPSQFSNLAHQLVDQDHVFAVAGIATAFFSPGYFVQTCTPTFGYNVTGNWQGPPNLYAAGGSVQYYPGGVPGYTYAFRQTKATSAAVLSYGIASSSAACQAAIKGFQQNGIKVGYQDLNVAYPGTSVSTDVQRMKAAGTNFVLSCMDVDGNVSMARAIQQYGLKTAQLWLNGNDQTTLTQYKSLMQGVYFNIQHVPLTAPSSQYPGLTLYKAIMTKYAPKYVGDEVAIQGYMSASLLVAGLQKAGKNPTQAGLVRAINSLTAFSSAGLTTTTNWSPGGGGHTLPTTYPTCSAFIQVKGSKYAPALGKKPSVWVCFNRDLGVKNPKPVTPPPGTPGPSA